MALSITQAALFSLASYVVWAVLRRFIVKQPLSYVAGPSRGHWLKGHFHMLFHRDAWDFHRHLYETYGSAAKLTMVLGDEQLFVTDPLAMHHVVVKDQYIYEETDTFITGNKLIFGTSLLSTLGEHHRKQRKMLNPVFSLKHMRDLIPVFYPIAHQLRDVLERQVKSGSEEFDVMRWISRAALEYIGQGGMGYTFNALDETVTNNYSDAIKSLGPSLFKLFLPRQFLPWLMNIGPPALRRWAFELLPFEATKTVLRVVNVMDDTSHEIFKAKKDAIAKGDEAVLNQVGAGKDIISILLRANMEAKEEDRLPEEELIGQMTTFIFAGHDTTTSAVCRVIHQLTINQDVQSKLRAEVTTARQEHGDLPYDILMGLPYLDAVCRETMRMFPPVAQLNRTTRKDIVLPLLWPAKTVDGKEITEIPLKKNTNVILSILGANRNKRIWGEDADQWKPERWLNPLPESVSKAHLPGVYASMMTFNGGGRACIGFKFSEMEMKLVLSILLERFVFSPGSQEIYWAMSAIQVPCIKGSKDTYPRMPLKVSLVQ